MYLENRAKVGREVEEEISYEYRRGQQFTNNPTTPVQNLKDKTEARGRTDSVDSGLAGERTPHRRPDRRGRLEARVYVREQRREGGL